MKHTVKEVVLKTGSKGLLIDVPNTNVVHMVAGFNSGALFCDSVKSPELSHVMEHVVMGANAKYPTRIAFETEVEKNGAYAGAFTSDYFNTYEYETADFEAEQIVKLMAAQISTPLFLPVEVTTEVASVREELSNYLSNFGYIAYDQLLKHTLQRPTYEDSLNTLDAVTPEVAQAYFHKTHTSDNMRFIFAGSLKRANKLLAQFEKGLSSQDKGERLPIPVKQPELLSKPVVITKSIPQIYYNLVQYSPELTVSDEPIISLISVLLTGRYKSRIFGEARERGLAYGVYSGGNNSIGYVDFSVSAFATPRNITELFKVISRELKAMRLGKINQTEVAEAKQLMVGRRARRYKTPGDLVSWYYTNYFARGHIEDFNRSTKQISDIKLSDVKRVAKHLFATPQWGLSLVGAVDKKLSQQLYDTISQIWQ